MEKDFKKFCSGCWYAKESFRFYWCSKNQDEVLADESCHSWSQRLCDKCQTLHGKNEKCYQRYESEREEL